MLLHSLIVSSSLSAMTKVLFDHDGPKCIDGSPAGYYISEGRSDRYVMWLEGGGICQGSSDCAGRAKSDLGSSTKWSPTMTDPRPLLSQNATDNPDFYNSTLIYVPYCSGDVWIGQMAAATNPWATIAAAAKASGNAQLIAKTAAANDEPLFSGYFHGHLIPAAIVATLQTTGVTRADGTTYTLGNTADASTDVLLTGCSAGGIGTFMNCDWLADTLDATSSGISVKCRPEAGWFGLPMNNYPNYVAHTADREYIFFSILVIRRLCIIILIHW